MSITASCGNCGKTYQAPDRMAGKSVRCKQCGEVFRIDAGDVGGIDLDSLEHSVSDEQLATHQASAMGTRVGANAGGPQLDEHGRPRIDRPGDVEAFAISGTHAPGFRSNYRFRYPGAKIVDQFLPVVLILLTLLLLTQACLSSEASTETTIGERPATGVAIGRLSILLAAYLIVIWPASHLALRMASVKTRFSMPSYAIWRSFAAFTPVVMMGGFLFVKSGGAGVALAMGLVVGVALAIGAVALLFRVFANEVPTVAAYVAVGSLGSAIFASLAIVAINMIAVALARLDKNPTLFVSPIAIGLPWIERPVTPVIVARKPSTPSKAITPTTPDAKPTSTIAVAAAPPAITPLQPLGLPKVDEDEIQLLKTLDLTPINPGFDAVATPPVTSDAMAVIRAAAGGVVEVWDDSTWRQPTSQVARGFELAQGALFTNTTAKKVFRLVHSPTDRLEQMPLGNTAIRTPITMVGDGSNRTAIGFLNENEVLIRSGSGGELAFESYDVSTGIQTGKSTPVTAGHLDANGNDIRLQVDINPTTVRILPDGSGVVVACRDPSIPATRLMLYRIGQYSRPESFRDIPQSYSVAPRPLGMAVRPSSRTAMLVDNNGEGYLSVWDLRDQITNGVVVKASATATLDRPVGVLSALRPPTWDDSIDPLAWIDDNTLLVYGNLVIDTKTGRRLGTLHVANTAGQYAARDGEILLLQSVNRINSLLKATFDNAALTKARGE